MIYILAFLVSITFFFMASKVKGLIKSFLYLLGLFPTIALAGLRDLSIGGDTADYPVYVFEYCLGVNNPWDAISFNIEEFYALLAYFSAKIFPHINVFLFITHSVILGVLLISFRRFKLNILLAFTLFYLLIYFETLNIARQSLSMQFCLLSLSFWIEKKYKWALIYMCIALGFHHTSLIFLIIHLIYYMCSRHFYTMNQTKIIVIIGTIAVIAIVFLAEILQGLASWGIVDYKYVERYGSSDMYGAGLPISTIFITSFNLYVYLSQSSRIRRSVFVVFSKYIVLITFLFCFAGLISTFIVRLGLYFEITSIICMTYLLMLRKRIMLNVVVLLFYGFYWFMVVVVANLAETYPYKSLILGI